MTMIAPARRIIPVAMKLTDVLPEFAEELARALSAHPSLAESVRGLEVVGRCPCRDRFCATFYTAPPPGGPYGDGHRSMVVDVRRGEVVLDVVDERIMGVEVLDRPDVRAALERALGRV